MTQLASNLSVESFPRQRQAPDAAEAYKVYRHPLPDAQPGRRSKYPFAQMKVGDCFYVPVRELKSKNALAAAARQWASRNSKDRKFATRVVDDLVGIWRIA